MKLIAKHLPLLALALLISCTQLADLKAEELPFKVGDRIYVATPVKEEITILEIKGKWVKGFSGWYNSDQFVFFENK